MNLKLHHVPLLCAVLAIIVGFTSGLNTIQFWGLIILACIFTSMLFMIHWIGEFLDETHKKSIALLLDIRARTLKMDNEKYDKSDLLTFKEELSSDHPLNTLEDILRHAIKKAESRPDVSKEDLENAEYGEAQCFDLRDK